jgi:hypothetical protein
MCRLAKHADLGLEGGRPSVPGIVTVGRVPDRRRQHPDDVCVPGGQSEHARPARAHRIATQP